MKIDLIWIKFNWKNDWHFILGMNGFYLFVEMIYETKAGLIWEKYHIKQIKSRKVINFLWIFKKPYICISENCYQS
jgi:hypothetical protein